MIFSSDASDCCRCNGTIVCWVVRVGDQFNYRIFKDYEITLIRDNSLHSGCIFALGTLCARRLDGWTATGVESLGLEGSCIGVNAHLATESVKFIDKMTLGESADRRIAGHLRDGRFLSRHEKCTSTHSGSGKSCFRTGVTSANNYDIQV